MKNKAIQNGITLIVLLSFLIGAIKERSILLATIFFIGIIIFIIVKLRGGNDGNGNKKRLVISGRLRIKKRTRLLISDRRQEVL